MNHQKFKAKGMKPTLCHYFHSSLEIGCKTKMHTAITCYTMVISIREGKEYQPFHKKSEKYDYSIVTIFEASFKYTRIQ